MSRQFDYTVARVRDGAYRLDRSTPPAPVATIGPVTDRTDQVIGWRLRPLVTVQGSRSKVWGTPAEAIASTKLTTPGQARTAITRADADAAAAARGAP